MQGFHRDFIKYVNMQPISITFTITVVIVVIEVFFLLRGLIYKNKNPMGIIN